MQSLNAENHYVFYFIHNYFKLNGGLTDANKMFVANRLQQLATWLYDTSMGTHLDYNQKLNVGIWSVKYLLENPNVTWEDFKNQFLTSQCEKIKIQRNDSNFQNKITDLQGKTGLTKETGYIQKWGGDYEYQSNASSTSTANTLSLPAVAIIHI
ncbi:hypothetical protein HIO71_06405 [Chryseobacterium aquaticum]|uniref:Uncharacterized protein n=1 Tax=Chryseobacterium aquaticum TaxID=452084 RepID=A0A848N5A3_9FLAO|nr:MULTISPECIES: hypothetical protein [Chryseobacterium]NMR33840.1 hypothetical protein [Chryseobacterium aquaticum]NRQ45916.1 hypothetical protein [Chryseobacterium sp. C-204]